VPASRRPARDQRAARADRPPDPADPRLAGRDPRPLRAYAAAEAGRRAGPLHQPVVQRRHGRQLPPGMLPVLRRRPCGDGRLRPPAVAVQLCALARAGRHRHVARCPRRRAVPHPRLQRLPRRRCDGEGAEARGVVRARGAAQRRQRRDSRCAVHPRQHPDAAFAGGRRLPGHHADFPERAGRRRRAEARRLHQVARCRTEVQAMTDVPANRRANQHDIRDRGLSETPEQRTSYLRAGHTLRSWFLTTDHKRIALLYLVAVTFFFFVGGIAAALIRIDLLTPEGDLLSNEGYNRAFTLHGVIMVWFFLIPSIPNTFGNFLIPLMIGAKDLAFPRLNLLSWYIYVIGGLFTLFVLVSGGVDTGWTFYTPLSSMFANGRVVIAATAVFIVGFSSILTGLNFIVTIHKLRCPGMTWGRLPLFVWSHYATSLILVLATPVLSITLALIAAERLFGLGVFDPKLGGDPLLYQHLFWFYSHPAVYIMVLPAIGVVSELIAAAARKPVFGYWFVAGASLAIAAIGFLVWGHHMFVAGESMYAGAVFSFLS